MPESHSSPSIYPWFDDLLVSGRGIGPLVRQSKGTKLKALGRFPGPTSPSSLIEQRFDAPSGLHLAYDRLYFREQTFLAFNLISRGSAGQLLDQSTLKSAVSPLLSFF